MTSEVEKYCGILSGTAFFEDFKKEELAVLVEACQPQRLAPRETLWGFGDQGEAAYFLIDGRLERTYRSHLDGQRVVQFGAPGDVLALSYLAKGWTHGSAAVALEGTELLRLERRAFEKLFAEDQTVAYWLIDRMAEELVREMRHANQRLHEVFGNPAETLRTLRRRVRQG